jgi:hypothetical protein
MLVICYVYGSEFIESLEKIALPSFLTSLKKSKWRDNINFLFVTKLRDGPKVQSVCDRLNVKANMIFEEEIVFNNLKKWSSHVDYWQRLMELHNHTEVFFLIPDNLYSTNFCSALERLASNHDCVMNYPFYTAKEPFLEDWGESLPGIISDAKIDQAFICENFLNYAHPLNWS